MTRKASHAVNLWSESNMVTTFDDKMALLLLHLSKQLLKTIGKKFKYVMFKVGQPCSPTSTIWASKNIFTALF